MNAGGSCGTFEAKTWNLTINEWARWDRTFIIETRLVKKELFPILYEKKELSIIW